MIHFATNCKQRLQSLSNRLNAIEEHYDDLIEKINTKHKQELEQSNEAFKKELERTNVDFLHQLTTYKLQIQALNEEIRELKESRSTYKTPVFPSEIEKVIKQKKRIEKTVNES